MREPENDREWQEAVDAAWVLRHFLVCVDYGLFDPAAGANLPRCVEIVARAAARGIGPSVARASENGPPGAGGGRTGPPSRPCQHRTAPG